jgi:membrane-associated protease RseP (regulator of RpoE activity)
MIPLGAFVSPTSEGVEVMKNLSLEKRTAIYAAGIRANFYTFFIGMIIGLFSMIATLTYLGLPGPEPKSIDHYWFISILIMGLIAVMYSFSNFFNHVVIPVLGLAMFIWLARLLLIEENIFTLFGTPVSGAVMMAPDFKNHEFTNLTGVHWEYAHLFANFLLVGLTFITLSLVLGIGNAMPIYPLDGGQMLVERIQSWGLNRTAAVVKEFGSTIAIMMIGLSVISDVIFFVK